MTVFSEYAQFYDLYYAHKDYAAEARFVLDVAGRFGCTPRSVLDMGCGTGRHITEFLKRGLKCEGFDRSPEMLNQARQRLAGLSVRLSQSDLTTFRSGTTHDLVVSLFAVMGYLVSNSDLIAGFRTARKHLNPGGVFIFDGWFGPAVLEQHAEHRRHEYRRNGDVIVREATPVLDPARETVTVRYDLEISKSGQAPQHIHEEHCLHLMFLQEIALAARIAGLELLHCCPFMEPDGQPNSKTWNVCFVARSLGSEGSATERSERRMDGVEWIKHGDQVLALIVPAGYDPPKSEFISPETYKQQVGFIVYPEDGAIMPHIHRELTRNLHGTSEVLLVRNGHCWVDFYLSDKSFLCTRELKTGDLLALVDGGHGFRMIEKTVFLEIKQGPYIGAHEKGAVHTERWMSPVVSVTQRAAMSVKWCALIEIVTRVAQPLIFLILARILVPADFGVMGTAMVVISFSQVFWDGGLGRSLVQTSLPLDKASNVVFWANVTLALVTYAILFASAPLLASFFHVDECVSVLRVLGLQVIIQSLGAVQQFLFVRDLGFRQLFWAKLAMVTAPGLCSIPMAFLGFGVWALVAGTMAGSLTNLLILWLKSPWRPVWEFDWAVARRLLVFGAWLVAESLGIWFVASGDQLILAKSVSMTDLGVYRVASNISLLIFAFLINPLMPVLYPMFSKLQNDRAKLRDVFQKANTLIMFITLPVSVGILLVGDPLASAFFGHAWKGLGFQLSILTCAAGMGWIVAANGEAYRSIGRPDVNTKFMYLQLLVYVPAYLSAPWLGIERFVLVKLAISVVTATIQMWLCSRILKLPRLYPLIEGRPLIIATAVMFAVVSIARSALPIPTGAVLAFSFFGGAVLLGVAAYLLVLWIIARPFLLSTGRLLLRAGAMD